MSEAAALFRNVCDNPDEDAPRLVYADWLDEHGDPDRAEFIRVQVARARLPKGDPARDDLWHRDTRLLLAYARTWRSGLPTPPGLTWGGFVRGFVGSLEMKPGALLRWAGELFEATPLRKVTLNSFADVRQFIERPESDRLRELELRVASVRPADVKPLLDAPALAKLTRLAFLVATPPPEAIDALRRRFGTVLDLTPGNDPASMMLRRMMSQ
jgi:uncharacterized protein (TIGR02996 family)